MKQIKILGLSSVALAAIVLVVMLVRTARLTKIPTSQSASTPPVVTVDVNMAAQHLSQAVQFKTVTEQNRDETDWPVFLEFQTFLKQAYPSFYGAVRTEQVEIYAQWNVWQGSDPDLAPIVFLAHQDVVPANMDDGGWDFPPFSGQIADGFVYGRGTIDDKGSLIAILEAANHLAKNGFQPKRTLMFGFGHDEEVLGDGAKAMAANLKSKGIKPYAVVDEGGVITTGMVDVKGPVARVGVAEKGYLTLTLTAKARGGHSSMPPDYTAIGALSKAIAAVEAHPFKRGLDDIAVSMLKATAPEQNFKARMAIANLWLFKGVVEKKMRSTDIGRAILGTTIAPTIINAGFKENALPREAKAYINFRIHGRDSIESVTKHVERVIDDENITIEQTTGFGSEPSPISQIGTGPWVWMEKVINQAFPGTIVAPNTVLGGTDSRYFAIVTDDIYRFAPYVFDASDIARIHGLNERMNIESFAKAIDTYGLMFVSAGNFSDK